MSADENIMEISIDEGSLSPESARFGSAVNQKILFGQNFKPHREIIAPILLCEFVEAR